MDDYSQYPIISVNEGLARVMNKKTLFARVLKSFAANPREQDLLDALSSRDLEAAVAATHTVKGMAANLSLIRLQRYAESIEHVFKLAKESGDTSAFDNVDAEEARRVFKETLDEVNALIPTLQ